LGQGSVQIALLDGSLALAVVVELLNAAIEVTIERVSVADHPLSKIAKHVDRATVAVTLAMAASVW
jgi:diacylglycerol kinase (ATP)